MKMTLAQWRRAKGLSQTQLGSRLGVHYHTVALWEANPAAIKIGQAVAVAKALDVPFDDIIFVENSTKCSNEEG